MQYKTISKEATVEMEEKKSRFIANVKPVSSEEEALEFINNIRAKYWDATHNVYAYCINGDSIIRRFSDDGEPSGTAGLPVLEVINKNELMDVVVVVTRYFGGTLLGASGLVRAYGKAAMMGIGAAGMGKKVLCEEIRIVLEYPVFGKLQNYIASQGYRVRDINYAQDIVMTVLVPVNEKDGFIKYVNNATNGEALVETGEKEYVVLALNNP
jgi:uncharacterized YigZ family protein